MKIVVVGGGTAGCLTALFCQRYFPKSSIVQIDSSTTGVIGVGESTTPSLIELLDFLGISIQDMIINCGATVKNSTRFTNWNGDGKIYHHGFNTTNDLDIFTHSHKSYFSNSKIIWPAHKSLLALNELYYGRDLENIHLGSQLSLENKVPFAIENIDSLENFSSYGLHFDARKVADYFKKLSIERGVSAVDGLIAESTLNERGYVQQIKLQDGREFSCDFVFDCSGFSRLFTEKTYKSKFNSFSKYLPVKQAIPFFLERQGKTPTFTEAIAMKYGWMWKTPVEGRFGCGYVFDNDYINQDKALEEVSEFLGFEPKVNRSITFESGYFESPWNKNVLAVGLSTGFLEPLEATSIWITVISLHLLVENIPGLVNKDEKTIKEYNEKFTKAIDSILALVQFHYYTKRKDSKFWIEFREKNQVPDSLKQLLDLYTYRLPSMIESHQYNTFPAFSWLLVGSGINYFNKEMILREYVAYNIPYSLPKNVIESFYNKIKSVTQSCIDHDEFLNYYRKKL